MSKKHFVALAKALAEIRETENLDAYQHGYVCRRLAIALQAQNPKFDADKFLHACKVA